MRNFRKYFILIAIIMLMSSFCINYLPAEYETKKQPSRDSEPYAKDADEKDGAAKKNEPAGVKNKLCPVDFKKITPDAGYSYTYKDKIYFFHSPKCIEEFKNDPEGYLKAWEKKERFYKLNIIYD
jgi:YHS domain-containing protein